MGVFDEKTRTITHKDWDDEEVVIKELTYGESKLLAANITEKSSEADLLASGEKMMMASIISWTFTKDGEIMPLDTKSFTLLPNAVVTYIMKQIEGFAIKEDAEFHHSNGAVPQGQEKITAGA